MSNLVYNATSRTEGAFAVVTAPKVTAWEDLDFYREEVEDETGELHHTTFALVEDDIV